MTKTETIRLELLRAMKSGEPTPMLKHLATLIDGSIETACVLKKRVLARGLVATKAGRPAQRTAAPTRKGRLPYSITHAQHAADLALLARVKAEWGLA